ncbi:heterokaryon incompatibility protein-domain-containing protein [Staphylotrichum tortipilum]|uniref:Heterokaryon incompatibility protein-domain-containing protein n=1 Tax=Staphylotrichum tortipilum TaxID=2831512 RepID=A0AAN6MGS8_9PEZI|nr:heterokaryon incompatibility protein-domain-containing protein [Staphylotrichum longicolle]
MIRYTHLSWPSTPSCPQPPPPSSEARRTIPNDYTHYHPLRTDIREIRLLHILPGTDDAPLTVSLVRTNLSNPTHLPPYRALSYCWGPLTNLQPIAVHFHDDADVDPATPVPATTPPVTFQITTSLHSALTSLRRTPNNSPFLWIDMLCINQGDLAERSGHVRFMRDVYRRAEEVVVWLGADEELKRSVFARQSYEMALANLALEEGGWVAEVRGPFRSFLRDVQRGGRLAGRGEGDGSVVGTDSSAFAVLLEEAQAVFNKASVGQEQREARAGFRAPHENYDDPDVARDILELNPSLWDSLLEGIYHPYKDSPSALGHAFRAYLARATARDSELWDWFAAVMPLRWLPNPDLQALWHRMTTVAAAPWFHRIWVIQEVASSKRVRIRVGEQEGNWELLRAIIRFCFELAANDAMFRRVSGLSAVVPILWRDLIDYRDSNTLNIARLLDAVPSFSATDPRDMAIAIYGIADDVDPGLFKPDYRQSVGETYSRFTLAVIRSTGNLDILLRRQVGIQEGKPDGLPSWAPDLTKPYGNPSVLSLRRQERPSLGESSPRIRETTDWRVLHVEGVSITKVAAVITTESVVDFIQAHGGDQDPISELSDVRVCDLWAYVNSVYSETFLSQGSPSPTRSPSKPTLTSFSQALLGGWTRPYLSLVVATWHHQDPQFASVGTSQETRDELARLRSEFLGDDPALQAIHQPSTGAMLLGLSLQRQALFLSEDGDLGICPPWTKVGDSIVALYGLDGLVVLRAVEGAAPEDGRYRVVGKSVFNSPGYEEMIRQHAKEGGGRSEPAGGDADGLQTPGTEWFKLE